jgi:hypothetical protein
MQNGSTVEYSKRHRGTGYFGKDSKSKPMESNTDPQVRRNNTHPNKTTSGNTTLTEKRAAIERIEEVLNTNGSDSQGPKSKKKKKKKSLKESLSKGLEKMISNSIKDGLS